jgi:Ohr subfamily peroxiredoxin
MKVTKLHRQISRSILSLGTTQPARNQLSHQSFHLKFIFSVSMKKNLYTADASAVGGRSGHVRSATGIIDLDMSVPEGLGGKKNATNPEELFAAGYASCFQQALLVIAQRAGDKLDAETTVQCSVTLFQEGEGYGLSAVLDVDLKSFDQAKTIEMVRQAHKICPYSVGTRGNMEVELKVKGEAIPVQAEENAGVAGK